MVHINKILIPYNLDTSEWITDVSGAFNYRMYNGQCFVKYNDTEVTTSNVWRDLGTLPVKMRPSSVLYLSGANNGYSENYVTRIKTDGTISIFNNNPANINGIVEWIV